MAAKMFADVEFWNKSHSRSTLLKTLVEISRIVESCSYSMLTTGY
jgi:hypothetical protein